MMTHTWSPTGARSFSLGMVLTALVGLVCAEAGRAQPPQSGMIVPRLFSVVPNGGKVGSTFEVTFTGQDIEDPEGLFFSHPGIKAEPIIPPAPPVDPKKPAVKPAPRPPVTKFKVTIAGDAPLGIHDARLINKWGISNPRAFVVGDLNEVLEKEPNDDVPLAQRVELNQTINGIIAGPADVDYFVFAGKKGQRVVVSCLASSIDSRLMAALELFDSTGRLLASNRHYSENDALVDCRLPADGDYYVRLHEFTHTQGGAEHFYRLTLSTAPWIDALFPLAIEPGKTAKVTVYGRNLPGGQLDPTANEDGVALEKLTVDITAPADALALQRLAYRGLVSPRSAALDGFEFRLRNASGASNPFLITYARSPVVLDQGNHDTPEKAQEIVVPCEISGRIEKLRDRDWYQFAAKKGDVYTIEVFGDRLGADLDMYLLLRKPDTKQDLADLDDNGELLTQTEFFTRTDDPPAYRFVVPADGKYQILVASRDADTRAGPRRFYRLRISPERPDFRLIVQHPDNTRPDACCLRQGADEQFTILVWRLEGWNGPVTVSVEGLPPGVTCAPQIVGPNLRQAALVLSASPTAPRFSGEIRVKGTAVIQGQTVVREARPGSITWPVPPGAGIPAVSRLDRNLVLAVREKGPFHLSATVQKAVVVQDSKMNVALKLARLWPDFKGPLQIATVNQPTNLPAGILLNNNQPVTMNPGKDDATAVLEVKAGVPEGTYNVVMLGTAQIPFNKDPAAKEKPPINVLLPSTPISLTVLPNRVANLTLSNANPTAKIGADTEVVVKVARLRDFAGEFRIQLVVPANVQGISAGDAIIPPGKNEAKLVLTVPAGAAPGNRPNLVVRALATIHEDIPLTHDTPLNVNVVK